MVQRWDPFNDLRQMQDTMDRMWRRIGNGTRESNSGADFEAWAVPLDVSQQGDETVIRASLPGVAPADIDVSIEDNVLTIHGETSTEHQEETGNYLMRERRTGKFHRALRLPDSVDPEGSESRYDHGVLTITIPKAEAKKAKRLQVQVGDAPAIEAASD